MGKRWLYSRKDGTYETPQFNGRTYVVARCKPGKWMVSDHPKDGSTPWPPLFFPTLGDAERALKACPVLRTNIMSRQEFWESAGTPYYCSPSSETYWSS